VVRNRVLLALFMIGAAVAVAGWARLARFERHAVVLKNARGMPVRLVLYEPAGAGPRPAILVCQPVNSPPEAGMALIEEFVQRGWLAAAFDFRGVDPAENRVALRENMLEVTALDAAAALRYLAARQDVDRSRIGLIGHSFGGTLAIRAGIEQPWVRATVAVGIAGDVTKTQPQNLLWLVGLYDEFRPLAEMHQVLEASNSDGVAVIERTAGDLAKGTARRLDVTPTADHFTEFLDPGTGQRAGQWFASSFAGRPVEDIQFMPATIAAWSNAGRALAFLSGWLLLLGWLRSYAPSRRSTLAMAALIAALAVVPLSDLALLRTDLALWGLALLIAVNAPRPGSESGSGQRATLAARLVVLGWASFVITLAVNQAAYFWRYPRLLLALPAFPFWHAVGLVNQYLFIYPRPLLFRDYTGALLRPGWVCCALLALEVVRPGVVTGSIAWLVQRIQQAHSAGAPQVQRTSWPQWAAAGALCVALSVIGWMRFRQGFVDRDSLALAAWVILRFAVLPFFVFALLKRILRGSL
jgi:dienelactone hydrolase